jgi:Family of unknown function (DUF6518)
MRRLGSPTLRRMAAVVAVAIVFGVAMSVLKGNGPGARDDIGNISAPWLALPFMAGAVVGTRRISQGAAVGFLALLAALAAFYVANSLVLDLGPHPWWDDLRLAVEGGRLYFALAILGGPTFGALGAWWRRRQGALVGVLTGVLVAALMVFEPLAWFAYGRAQDTSFPINPAVQGGEVVIGFGACILAGVVARRVRPGASITDSAVS